MAVVDGHAVRIVIAGHVDHGKSTLVGRLLHDTGNLSPDKVAALQAMSKKRSLDHIEWSFALDSFQDERNQNVTIDTSQVFFSTENQRYQIIDAPGHAAFLQNAISGAAYADAAILVVDALEGVCEQTRRHAQLLHVMGLQQLIVVINKMDLVAYNNEIFFRIQQDLQDYLTKLDLIAEHVVPVCAMTGDNFINSSENMPWYAGPILLQALESFEVEPYAESLPLRMPVQDVYKMGTERIIVGRLETGFLKIGERIRLSPTGEETTVKKFYIWPEASDKTTASAGESVAFSLDDKVYSERGYVISHTINLPRLGHLATTKVFWLDEEDMRVGDVLSLRCATQDVTVTLRSIDYVVDTSDLTLKKDQNKLSRGDVAAVTFRARDLLVMDPAQQYPRTGRFVLHRGHKIVGGGLFLHDDHALSQPFINRSSNISTVSHLVTADQRYQAQKQKGGVFWLTGLSGSGKSTLAMLAEKELFDQGMRLYVLDGDNIRHGLCADLGFSIEDRTENIRRIGEVAKLMTDAGVAVITSFISPFSADRNRVKESVGQSFHEIYIKAGIDVCEKRDPKGLYLKARTGQIADFTGIDSPYDIPENPDLIIDTQHGSIEECVRQLCDYVRSHTKINSPMENKRDL